MNIIFISAELPYPANSGGRIYTWERLKQLKKNGNKIYLFSLYNKEDKFDSKKYEEMCVTTKIYLRKNKFINGLKYITKPFSVASRFNSYMFNDINKLIHIENVDLIIIDIPEMLMNCPLNNEIPRVLTQHNIEYKVFHNISNQSKNIIKKLIYKIEALKMKYYEEKFYKKKLFKGYTFISKDDMKFFMSKYKDENCICIPPGFNKIEEPYKKKEDHIIVFTGKMDYEPNVQAVQWFANQVFPNIKSKINEAKFYIVGKNPTKEVKKLSSIEGVVVTGSVDNIDYYLKMANLYVIPLKSGGGVKIKLFEAIGHRNIVVTTSKGIEGTDFVDKQHLLVANDTKTFTKMCIKVLMNQEKYQYLVDNSIKLLQDKYSWDSLGKRYSNFLLNLN